VPLISIFWVLKLVPGCGMCTVGDSVFYTSAVWILKTHMQDLNSLLFFSAGCRCSLAIDYRCSPSTSAHSFSAVLHVPRKISCLRVWPSAAARTCALAATGHPARGHAVLTAHACLGGQGLQCSICTEVSLSWPAAE
jgi:hypothetical protein